jgi:hypothetical protein
MCQLKPPSDYASVYRAVSTFGPASHVLDSFCLVAMEKTPTELRNALRTQLNGPGSIIITHVTQKHADYLPSTALEWIAAQNGGKPEPNETQSSM